MKPKIINFGYGISIHLIPNCSEYSYLDVIYVECEIRINAVKIADYRMADRYEIPCSLQFFSKVIICSYPLEPTWGTLYLGEEEQYRWDFKRFYASTWFEAAVDAELWGREEIHPLLVALLVAIEERQAKIDAVGDWIVPDAQ